MSSKAIFLYCSVDCNLLEFSPFLLLSRESGYTQKGKSSGSLPQGELHGGKNKLPQGEPWGCPIMTVTVWAKPLILGFILGSSKACACKPHSALALSASSFHLCILGSFLFTSGCYLCGFPEASKSKYWTLNLKKYSVSVIWEVKEQ